MADAPLARLADAITTEINAQSWSQSCTATRVYLPLVDLDDLSTLAVHVVPARQTDTRIDRSQEQTDYTIDIFVAKETADDQDANDALLYLLHEMHRHFRGTRNEDPSAICVKREVLNQAPAGYNLDDLDQRRQFTGVLRLIWRAFG